MQLRREAIDAGFDAFLDKPADIASLLKALQPA
jgi:CheY-like chemotaxis protein